MRVWVTSVVIGCVVSGMLSAWISASRVALYFPPFWPGLFFAWAVIIIAGEQCGRTCFAILTSTGNAAFYGLLTSRVIRAEIRSRGRLSRYFLR